MNSPSVYTVLHHPASFASRSGFAALLEQTRARPIYYDLTWERWSQRSWTAGYALRRLGNWYYGSEWNALVPFLDEWRFLKQLPRKGSFILHFLWGEFASPRSVSAYKGRGARILGGFHCSPRRWKTVLGTFKLFQQYDHITLTSSVQKELVIKQGVPEDKISIIPLGVDMEYFCPAPRAHDCTGPLKAIMVGDTERDHEFLSQIARRMSAFRFELAIRTSHEGQGYYQSNPVVKVLPRISDAELVRLYQEADIMIMPMLDSAANDALLEAMACGTPVMVNRIGGISEYVDDSFNYVMNGKKIDEWVDVLTSLIIDKQSLENKRAGARESVERFSWDKIVPRYQKLYARLLEAE